MIRRVLASVLLGLSDRAWDLAIALNPKIRDAAIVQHPAGRRLYLVRDSVG